MKGKSYQFKMKRRSSRFKKIQRTRRRQTLRSIIKNSNYNSINYHVGDGF